MLKWGKEKILKDWVNGLLFKIIYCNTLPYIHIYTYIIQLQDRTTCWPLFTSVYYITYCYCACIFLCVHTYVCSHSLSISYVCFLFLLEFFFSFSTSYCHLSSLFGHKTNQVNYGLWAKSSPLSAFVNRVLWEHRHSKFAYILYRSAFALQRQSCIFVISAMMRPVKSEIFTMWPFIKKKVQWLLM